MPQSGTSGTVVDGRGREPLRALRAKRRAQRMQLRAWACDGSRGRGAPLTQKLQQWVGNVARRPAAGTRTGVIISLCTEPPLLAPRVRKRPSRAQATARGNRRAKEKLEMHRRALSVIILCRSSSMRATFGTSRSQRVYRDGVQRRAQVGVQISLPRLVARIKIDAHTAGERRCKAADDGAAVASR